MSVGPRPSLDDGLVLSFHKYWNATDEASIRPYQHSTKDPASRLPRWRSGHAPEQVRRHERLELVAERAREGRVIDDDAGLDVPLLGGLGEVGRGDEGAAVVDDDALGVETSLRSWSGDRDRGS